MTKDGEIEDFVDTDENSDNNSKKAGLDAFFEENKATLVFLLLGLIFIGLGVFFYKQGLLGSSDKIEIISSDNLTSVISPVKKQLVAEIAGAVEKPGVYKLEEGSRVEDLLILSGGVSANADRAWVDKFINRAAKLSDGQKIYIFSKDEQSTNSSANILGGNPGVSSESKTTSGVMGSSTSGLVNINTASLQELDVLPGIGQVYGKSIIEHRPYSDVSELLSKGALKQSVYEKVKDKVSVY